MRSDMSKVIVERPRFGSKDRANPMKGYLKNMDLEDMPTKESMKKPYGYGKVLNENLRPLERYLGKQVGRVWDDVYSDISQHLNKNNPVQFHVFQHIEDFVELKLEVKNGVALTDRTWTPYYVDPFDGILKKRKKKYNKGYWKPKPNPNIRVIDELHELHKFDNGLWYLLTLEKASSKDHIVPYRFSFNMSQLIGTVKEQRHYKMIEGTTLKNNYWCVGKKQLSKKELKKYGL